MSFNSLIFLIFFIPIFLILFFLIPKKYKYLVVLLGSLLFYINSGLFNFCLILILSLFNYLFGLLLSKYKNKLFLILGLVLDIGSLAFFKYTSFVSFPLGISFYMFNNIGYLVDVYKEKFIAEKNILYYFTFSMFFVHVTMGPIIKYDTIRNKIKDLGYSDSSFFGFKRFLLGLYKKVLIADNLGLLHTTLMASNDHSIMLNVSCLIIYALWLYIDFSSYTDMAIGLGKVINIDYPENFNYPYQAISVSDFWRRWHISLTKFFRDYVYIPLGGNRVNKLRCILNILIVWFLTGIWHGNTVNFLLWGIYYGIILILEKYVFKNILNKMPNFLRHIYVILCVLIGYIFFSISDFNQMILFIKGLFMGPFINKYIIFYLKENIVLLIFATLLCFKLPICFDKIKNNKVFKYITIICLIIFYILTISYIVSGSYLPFLYNDF